MDITKISVSGQKYDVADKAARAGVSNAKAVMDKIAEIPDVDVNANTLEIVNAINLLLSKFRPAVACLAVAALSALQLAAGVVPKTSPHNQINGDIQIVTNTVELISAATNGIPEAIALKADKSDTFTKEQSSTNAEAKAKAAIAAAGCVRTNEYGAVEGFGGISFIGGNFIVDDVFYASNLGIGDGYIRDEPSSEYPIPLSKNFLGLPWCVDWIDLPPNKKAATLADIPDVSNVVRTNEHGTAMWRTSWDGDSPIISANADTPGISGLNQLNIEVGGVSVRTDDDDYIFIGWPHSTYGSETLALVSQIEAATNGLVTSQKWPLSSITNAQGRAVSAADVGAVPYTGATNNVDLGTFGMTADYVFTRNGCAAGDSDGIVTSYEKGQIVQVDYSTTPYPTTEFLTVPFTSGTLAVESWSSLSAMLADSTPQNLSANSTFSNAVLSVGISTNVLATVQEIQSLGTNTVHQIADFVSAFEGIGITLPQGGVTLAGLLAALVAAVTWLKKNKADKGDIPALKGQTFDLSKDAEFKLMCVAVAKALGATVLHINPIDDNTTGNDVASMYGITPTNATTYGDIETRAGLSDTDTPEDF